MVGNYHSDRKFNKNGFPYRILLKAICRSGLFQGYFVPVSIKKLTGRNPANIYKLLSSEVFIRLCQHFDNILTKRTLRAAGAFHYLLNLLELLFPFIDK